MRSRRRRAAHHRHLLPERREVVGDAALDRLRVRRLEAERSNSRDELRIEALKASDDPDVAGLAAKIDREEAYHRIHAEMWIDRLLATDEGRAKLEEAAAELWPYALGVLDDELRPAFVERVAAKLPFELPPAEPVTREQHTEELRELWEEMTSVRRSVAGATW